MMITREFYPLVLVGYHLGLAMTVCLAGWFSSKMLGITDARTRGAGIFAFFTIIEATAMYPMVAFVNSHVRIRGEDLNFLVTHTILVAVLLMAGCVLGLRARCYKAQLMIINLLSVPFVLVAWLSG